MKRLISILLSLVMVIGILPMSVFSANASIVDIPATPSPVAGVTGMGTFTDPYVATTGDQLEDLIATKKAMNIKIGSNLTLDKTLYIRAEVYVDINGKTITSTADNGFFNIKSSGSLTTNGNGNISYKGDYYAIFVEGEFEALGSITYAVENKSYAVINTQEYGVVNIYGGTFKGSQIDNNGVGKIYIYGGTFEEVLYTGPNAMTVIYDGTFLGAVGTQGKVYIYDGEFLDAVNAYNSGVITVYTGHFAKGFALNNATGFHRADGKSYCVTHKNKNISDLGLYLYEEVTVYGPAFENQVPYANGKTEIDGGTMNQYESYTVGFTAKDVPEIFAELGFSVEEKLVVKDSNGKVVHSASKKGTTARGVYYNMQELDGGDYSVERIINLYRDGSIVETKMDTVKVKVNPISEQDFGFKTMTPAVSDEDKADRYTELSDKPLETQTFTFGFTPQLSQTLKDKGYRVEEKIQVTYNNQGTIVTLNSGANFNLMKYVKAMGDYQVWFTMNLYRGNEYVTSLGHIYNVTIVHNPVRTIKANVTAPVDGALPNATVTPAGEGYQTTDVDWSYYNETYDEYYIMPDGMKFEAGKTYECAVQFEALDEYAFAEDKADMVGYINGYKGVISPVYSDRKAYVTVQFTVLEKEKLEVIFTPDSKAQVDSKLTVDIERMAEKNEELMEAYLNDEVKYTWYYQGFKIKNTSPTLNFNKYDVGSTVLVIVSYGDQSITSEEFVIADVPKVLSGDANNDGTLDVNDVTAMQMYLAHYDIEVSEEALDVNGDGNVDINDVTALQMIFAGYDI